MDDARDWGTANLETTPKPAHPGEIQGTRKPVPEAGEGYGGIWQSIHDWYSAKSDSDGALMPTLSAQVQAAMFEKTENALNGAKGHKLPEREKLFEALGTVWE